MATAVSQQQYAHPLANTYVWTSEDHKNRAKMWETAKYVALFAAASFIVISVVFCFYSPVVYTFVAAHAEAIAVGIAALFIPIVRKAFAFLKFLDDKCSEHSIKCTIKESVENKAQDREAYRESVNASGANRLAYLEAYYTAREDHFTKKSNDLHEEADAVPTNNERVNLLLKWADCQSLLKIAYIKKTFVEYVRGDSNFNKPLNIAYPIVEDKQLHIKATSFFYAIEEVDRSHIIEMIRSAIVSQQKN